MRGWWVSLVAGLALHDLGGPQLRVAAVLIRDSLDFNCSDDEVLCDQTSGHLVMFDAGSTGTRVHVYQYSERMVEATGVIVTPLSSPTQLAEFDIEPGISSYSLDPHGLWDTLRPLSKAAADALLLHKPDLELGHVPVYLGATAGVRNLTHTAQRAVMSAVRSFFRSSESPFAFRTDAQARVLSGEEEGTFAWLGLNYFMSSIGPDPASTYGSLDFGGVSMQITFEPEDRSILAGFFPLHFSNLHGRPIHLYTHSYLQFGKTASFERATEELMHRWKPHSKKVPADALRHPCMPKDLEWNVTPGEFGVSTRMENPERTNGSMRMKGTGDFNECWQLAKTLIEAETTCYQPPCRLAGVYQPLLGDSHFVLLEHFDALMSWQVMPLYAAGVPLLRALRQQLVKVCALPTAVQRELMGILGIRPGGNGVPPCWQGTWIYTFLTHGLGFNENSTKLKAMKDCCDNAAGRAIYEVNFFPSHMTKRGDKVATRPTRSPPPEGDPLLLSARKPIRLQSSHPQRDIAGSVKRDCTEIVVAALAGLIAGTFGTASMFFFRSGASSRSMEKGFTQPLLRALA